MPPTSSEPAIRTDAAPQVSRYREFAPPPALARYVVCTWAQEVSGGANAYPQRVLPDACVDLVCIGSEPPKAVGPATAAVVASLPPHTTIVGIRFRPGCAPQGLGLPASDLLDQEVPLADLWGEGADALAEQLRAPSVAARLGALEQAVLARCSRAHHPVDPLARAAVAWLARRPQGRVEELARHLEIGPRRLHRRFAAAVGYPPKVFQRVVRFQRLLDLARRPGPVRASLVELAYAAGYADQAHMTREVGALAGRTPAALVGRTPSTLALSDLVR